MHRSAIYHYPFSVRQRKDSGSQVHLTGMLEGFKQLGYDLELVTGSPGERRAAIQRISTQASGGRNFDLLFAWAPASPTLLLERNLLHPFLDLRFFRWCRSQSIPVGLFYGDVHWRFDHYRVNVPLIKRIPVVLLFWFDWLGYRKYVDHLFLPSLRMRASLPTAWPIDRTSELLPGCSPIPLVRQPAKTPPCPLELFYVGGIVPPLYDLKPMFDVVRQLDGVLLTVCCRPSEWERVRSYYAPIDGTKIRIVHESGSQLEAHYARADLFGLFWRPYPYLDITMPVKVFESIGFGLPIVTSEGTVASRFIAQQDVGWVVSTEAEFRELLVRLAANPDLIEEKRKNARVVCRDNTWQARAQLVARTLLGPDPTIPADQVCT